MLVLPEKWKMAGDLGPAILSQPNLVPQIWHQLRLQGKWGGVAVIIWNNWEASKYLLASCEMLFLKLGTSKGHLGLSLLCQPPFCVVSSLSELLYPGREGSGVVWTQGPRDFLIYLHWAWVRGSSGICVYYGSHGPDPNCSGANL